MARQCVFSKSPGAEAIPATALQKFNTSRGRSPHLECGSLAVRTSILTSVESDLCGAEVQQLFLYFAAPEDFVSGFANYPS